MKSVEFIAERGIIEEEMSMEPVLEAFSRLTKKRVIFHNPHGQPMIPVESDNNEVHIFNWSVPTKRKVLKRRGERKRVFGFNLKGGQCDSFFPAEIPPLPIVDNEGNVVGEVLGTNCMNVYIYNDLTHSVGEDERKILKKILREALLFFRPKKNFQEGTIEEWVKKFLSVEFISDVDEDKIRLKKKNLIKKLKNKNIGGAKELLEEIEILKAKKEAKEKFSEILKEELTLLVRFPVIDNVRFFEIGGSPLLYVSFDKGRKIVHFSEDCLKIFKIKNGVDEERIIPESDFYISLIKLFADYRFYQVMKLLISIEQNNNE
jgi:hypothetical protein